MHELDGDVLRIRGGATVSERDELPAPREALRHGFARAHKLARVSRQLAREAPTLAGRRTDRSVPAVRERRTHPIPCEKNLLDLALSKGTELVCIRIRHRLEELGRGCGFLFVDSGEGEARVNQNPVSHSDAIRLPLLTKELRGDVAPDTTHLGLHDLPARIDDFDDFSRNRQTHRRTSRRSLQRGAARRKKASRPAPSPRRTFRLRGGSAHSALDFATQGLTLSDVPKTNNQAPAPRRPWRRRGRPGRDRAPQR